VLTVAAWFGVVFVFLAALAALGEGPPPKGRPCSSCGAPLRWGRTRSGRALPVDAEPAADGNCRISRSGAAEVLGPLEVALAVAEGETLYRPHFATCPNAAEHRR
jgi:hypothetical protein